MKVISLKPEPAPQEKPWWPGRQMTCLTCGTVVEIDETDVPASIGAERATGIIRNATFSCPGCGWAILVYRRPEIDPATLQLK